MLVEIAFPAWILLMIIDQKYRSSLRHPLVIALAAFTGFLILTMFTGVDWYRSFWSTEERMTGLFTMFHLYVWFLMVVSIFRTQKEWRRLILLSIGVSGIVSLYGFAGWNQERVFSTIGNATFFAEYIMLHIFLILYILFLEKKYIKIFYLGLFLLLLLDIYQIFSAGSRGTVMALGVGGMMVLFAGVGTLKKTRAFFLLSMGGVFLLILGSILFFNLSLQGKQWANIHLPFAAKRIVFFESYTNNPLLGRPEMWRIAFEGWKEKPIFGWGLENYPYIFQKYYERPLPGDEESYSDRSHNQLIDTLALTGIVGFASSLFLGGIILYLIYQSWKKRQVDDNGLRYAVLGGFFIAYFIQSLTIFDSPTGLILFYIALGLLCFLTTGGEEFHVVKRRDPSLRQPAKLGRTAGAIVSFISLIGAGYLIYAGNILPWIQDVQGKKGLDAVKTYGLQEASLAYFKSVLNASSFTNYEIRLHLAEGTFDAYMAKQASSEDYARQSVLYAITELDKSIASRPLDVKNYFAELLLYRIAGKYDETLLEKAEKRMQSAYALAPNRPEIYREFPEIYIAKKDYTQAEEWVRKGADHFIPSPETHWQLAGIFLQKGDIDKSLTELTSAEQLGYPVFENINMAIVMAKKIPDGKKNPSALHYIDRIAQIHPDDKEILAAQTEAHKKAE